MCYEQIYTHSDSQQHWKQKVVMQQHILPQTSSNDQVCEQLKRLFTFLPHLALGNLRPSSLCMGEADLTEWVCMLQAAPYTQNSLLAALLLSIWSRIKPGGPLLLIATAWGHPFHVCYPDIGFCQEKKPLAG